MKIRLIKLLTLPVFSFFTLVFYLFASFIVGWQYLTNIQGSDTLAYLSHLKLLSEYFPKYPFWNHLEGAGVSLTASYPYLTHTLLIVISRVTNLNLIQTLKLAGFLSVPLFSLGIYLFALSRTKNILVSFLAGFFYIISPIAWIFLFEWGFYAESLASVLFPPILIFFCLYIDKPKKIYLILTSLFIGLGLLAHPTIATAAVTFMAIYGASMALLQKDKLRTLLSYAGAVLFMTLLGLFFAALWFFPYYQYSQIAALGGNVGGSLRVDEYYRNRLYISQILGFIQETDKTNPVYNFRNLSFPSIVSFLFIIGAVFTFFSKKKDQIALCLSVLILLFFSVSVPVTIILKYIPVLDTFASWRSFIYIPRLGLPILAALAGYYFFYYLLFLIKKNLNLRIVLASIAGFLVTVVLIWVFKDISSYGIEVSISARKLDYRDIWKVRSDDPCLIAGMAEDNPYCKDKVLTKNYNVPDLTKICTNLKITTGICSPNFTQKDVSDLMINCGIFCDAKYKSIEAQLFDDNYYFEIFSRFREGSTLSGAGSVFSKIQDNDFYRYDLSTGAVEYSKLSPYLKKTPALPAYINQSWLINRFWGYELSNFYADDPVYSDHSALLDIAKWFGVKSIIFGGAKDSAVQRFNQPGFTKVDEQPIYQVDNNEMNVAVNNKPKILVIGKQINPSSYDEVFKEASFGIVPYTEAMLIKGREKIDSYSLDELKKYDVLFLYGYSYSSRNNAWQLLDNYLKSGGSVFIDTGWQYTSADWNAGSTSSFFPVDKLSWTNFGKTSDYSVDSSLFDNSKVNVGNIEPLIWNNLPWGVSSGNLRSWAKPILSVPNGILVAGGIYGNGKIVWSGMNTLGHIKSPNSSNPESIILGNAISWLLGNKDISNLSFGSDFSAREVGPDKVEITFNRDLPQGYGLYFKESYFPYWKVNGLKIEYAGPGFMYISLPQIRSGDKITFVMTPMFSQVLGYAVSAFGIVFSILYLFGIVKFDFLKKIRLRSVKIASSVDEEKNY